MATIINFGTPRSGTSYIAKMFESVPYLNPLGSVVSANILPHIYDNMNTIDLTKANQFFNTLDRCPVYLYHFKIGEASSCHPMNNQVLFDELCKMVPQPVYLYRTFRHPIKIYRSMMEREGRINVLPRFKPLDIGSISGMIMAEYAGYLAIKDSYEIQNINFDDKDSIINSVQNQDSDIARSCINFIHETYNKKQVRPGIRSEKVTIDIDRDEEEALNRLYSIIKDV